MSAEWTWPVIAFVLGLLSPLLLPGNRRARHAERSPDRWIAPRSGGYAPSDTREPRRAPSGPAAVRRTPHDPRPPSAPLPPGRPRPPAGRGAGSPTPPRGPGGAARMPYMLVIGQVLPARPVVQPEGETGPYRPPVIDD